MICMKYKSEYNSKYLDFLSQFRVASCYWHLHLYQPSPGVDLVHTVQGETPQCWAELPAANALLPHLADTVGRGSREGGSRWAEFSRDEAAG